MKETIDAYCSKLTQIMNDCLKNIFSSYTKKNAEITPCFKKGNKGEKENYGPVSIMSYFSKVFERLICNQLNKIFQISPWLSKKPQYTIHTTKNDRKLENTVK